MNPKGIIDIIGHVHIQDDLGQVLLDDWNAVHPQNMATIIGRALANAWEGNLPASPNQVDTNAHWVNRIELGNGGASVASGGAITYETPITTPSNASLYNATYSEIVDEAQGSDGSIGFPSGGGPSETPNTNSVVSASGSGVQTTVTVVVELSAAQPASQSTDDQAASSEDDFAFDELGLKSTDDLLLSHIVFSPILKSANRTITITYTLTITVS